MSELPINGKVYGQNLWTPPNVRLSDRHFPVRCTLINAIGRSKHGAKSIIERGMVAGQEPIP
ncbi:hypothetical protein AJ87_18330 [Rhizobium yanglingense]|nr:hypothetical protein AJ87_18330 [Rhizobium yanglingense]